VYSIYTSYKLQAVLWVTYDICTSVETTVLEMPMFGGDSSQPVETHPSMPLDISAFHFGFLRPLKFLFILSQTSRDVVTLQLSLSERWFLVGGSFSESHRLDMHGHPAHLLRP
jgi:hypothetical protein